MRRVTRARSSPFSAGWICVGGPDERKLRRDEEPVDRDEQDRSAASHGSMLGSLPSPRLGSCSTPGPQAHCPDRPCLCRDRLPSLPFAPTYTAPSRRDENSCFSPAFLPMRARPPLRVTGRILGPCPWIPIRAL
jgi:hypothetical protein